MVAFVPTGDPQHKFFFNVSTPVGAGAKGSRPADILLVQFYFVMKQYGTGQIPEIFKKIRLTGVCDENLIEAIRVYQASHSGRLVQDGLVSRAQGTRFGAGPSWNYWTIVGMNFGFWSFCKPMWPRIDQHPKSNGAFSQVIREALGAV